MTQENILLQKFDTQKFDTKISKIMVRLTEVHSQGTGKMKGHGG